MTNINSFHRLGSVFGLVAVFCGLFPAVAVATDMKLEAVLVWGTNDAKSPDPEMKQVTADVAKKLACLPFKYTNYFEVNRKQFSTKDAGTARERLSKDCVITVKKLEGGKVEFTFIGKGQPVGKITQELKKGKSLVTGGNAANSTAWFVVLTHLE